MNDQLTLVQDYLARLDQALAEVPYATAREISAGVAEELNGLDEEQARTRIASLGDPREIAAAAVGETAADPVPPSPMQRTVDSVPFALATAGVVLVGAALLIWVVPMVIATFVIGMSGSLTRRQKLIANSILGCVIGGVVAMMFSSFMPYLPLFAESVTAIRSLGHGLTPLYVLVATGVIIALWLGIVGTRQAQALSNESAVARTIRLGERDVRLSSTSEFAVAALVVSVIGTVTFPVYGWLAGAVLVFFSRVWTASEKVIGLSIVPIMTVGFIVFDRLSGGVGALVSGGRPDWSHSYDLSNRVAWIFLGVVVAGAVIAALFLAMRAQRRAWRPLS